MFCLGRKIDDKGGLLKILWGSHDWAILLMVEKKSGGNAPVEVGSWNPIITRLYTSQVVLAGFLNHQPYLVKLDHFTSSSARGKTSTNIKKPRLSFPRSDLFPCLRFNFWIHIPGPSSWSKGTMVVHHAKASNLFLYIPFFSMRYDKNHNVMHIFQGNWPENFKSLNKNSFISLLWSNMSNSMHTLFIQWP